MSVADAVCVAWIPLLLGAGVWVALRPVGAPFVGPHKQVARACRYMSHQARHAYARLMVRREFRVR